MERHEDSRPWEGQLYSAWKAAGGRPVDGDFSDEFGSDWLDHVRRRILSGKGHFAARDTVAWGHLPSGLGYISLMACESLSEDEGGHADVLAARQVFGRALKDLADARGLIVDLRYNYGGWDRVPSTLASHLTDSTVRAFTKQPVGMASGFRCNRSRLTRPRPPFHRPRCGFDQRFHRQRGGGRNAGPPRPAEYPFVRASDLWRAVRSLQVPPAERLEGGGIERDLPGFGRHVYEGTGIPPDQLSAEPSARDFWGSMEAQIKDAEDMAAGTLNAVRGPHLMRRALLTTTAAVACLMLAPSAEAALRPAPRARRASASRRITVPAISLRPLSPRR